MTAPHPAARRLPAALSTLLTLAVGAAVLPLTSAEGASARPDLRVTSVNAAGPVTVGQSLRVSDRVTNTGASAAARSKVRHYLSYDRRYDSSDRLLGTRKVPSLKKDALSPGNVQLLVPGSTPPGSWHVVSCADATRKVAESRERNNCRATADPVTVTALPAPPVVTQPPPPPPAPPAPPPAPPTFPLDPDPLTVDYSVQDDRAVTVTAYPHEQTTITASAADGTTYTLTLPANALLGAEAITMTPVASVPGLPMSGGLVAGVQIEPHGLMLLEPATLVIESPDAGPLAAQTAFLFHEGGEDFHLYPMAVPVAGDDADTVRMTLTHFSTPGVGSATAADRDAAAQRVPERTSAQVEAAISEVLREVRAGEPDGGDLPQGAAQQITQVMNAYHDQVVRPRMQAAETNADLAAEAIAEGLAWSRQMSVLGDEANPRHAEILTRVETILHNVMNAGWTDCLDHDLTAINKLLRVARWAALLGFAWLQEAQDKAFGCARFEVRFDSLITSVGSFSGTLQSGAHDGRWRTSATVTVPFLSMDATGPLAFTQFSYSGTNTYHDADPDCTSTTSGTGTAPGQLRAVVVPMLGLNVREGETPPPPPVQVSATVPGQTRPTETYLRTACSGETSTWTDSRWASYFHHMRPSTLHTFVESDQLEDLVGTKTWNSTRPGDGYTDTEQTTIEVWHVPAQ